jgi:glycine hydroxymethyltransferase
MTVDRVAELLREGSRSLRTVDPLLHGILEREQRRQAGCLSLVASSSVADPSVLACQASVAVNVTAEGYPGRRFHAGCGVLDDIEQLAIDRARAAFGARYVNVQPHSASTANYIVLSALMRPGDTLLGMALEHGGHLTHGSAVAYAGQYFNAVRYGMTADGAIDYDQVLALAREHRPRVIVCGATAYPRQVDFARFRGIADEVGAYLVADISHTAGLVVTGRHPSPIDHAHVTTTCTHKQLYGPRGGLILSGPDADAPAPRGSGTLADFLQRSVFPFMQGAPAVNVIAAKARALAEVTGPRFAETTRRIVVLADTMARELMARGHTVVTGGTDNHIVLVDLRPSGVSGLAVEEALESCGIVVNKNRVPGDTSPVHQTGGIRLGTNSAAVRGLGEAEAVRCAEFIDTVVRALPPGGTGDDLPGPIRETVARAAAELCAGFPVPGYPHVAAYEDEALVEEMAWAAGTR